MTRIIPMMNHLRHPGRFALTLAIVATTHATLSASSQSGGILDIAKDQSALADIVIPEKARQAEQYAAAELADYLGQITGARFTVVSESLTQDRPRLCVGQTHAAQSVLAELSGEDEDTFAVRQIGKDIILVGASERATLYAVYDLLERELGCRWLAPGPGWEEVPQQSHVALSPSDRIERPGMKYRFERMTYLPTTGSREKECLTWAVRQRINIGFEWPETPAAGETLLPYGGFRGYMWPHSLPRLTDIDKLYREHPEWFALVNGKRAKGVPKNVNLCTTDPQVIAFMANLLKDCFNAQPQVEFLPLGPGDGSGFCQCERCQALDTGATWSHSGHRKLALGDRWMTFINEVADIIAVTNPSKKIYSLAYHQTFAPPLKLKPRPNVMMMVVNSRTEGVCFVHPVATPGCTNNAMFCRYFTEWAKITPAGLMAYQYMPHSTFCNMPLPAPHKFISDIRWLTQSGCVGYEGQSGYQNFGLFGITLYTVAKAMWNPAIDADSLLKDYCDSAFHEASEPMQRLLKTFEHGQQEADHTSTGIWSALTPTVLQQTRQHMNEAIDLVQTEKVKRRLAALDAHLAFAKGGCQAYAMAQEAVRKRDKPLLDRAEKLARKTEKELISASQADPDYVDLVIKPRSFNRFLKGAHAAFKMPARSQPERIDADHQN